MLSLSRWGWWQGCLASTANPPDPHHTWPPHPTTPTPPPTQPPPPTHPTAPLAPTASCPRQSTRTLSLERNTSPTPALPTKSPLHHTTPRLLLSPPSPPPPFTQPRPPPRQQPPPPPTAATSASSRRRRSVALGVSSCWVAPQKQKTHKPKPTTPKSKIEFPLNFGLWVLQCFRGNMEN